MPHESERIRSSLGREAPVLLLQLMVMTRTLQKSNSAEVVYLDRVLPGGRTVRLFPFIEGTLYYLNEKGRIVYIDALEHVSSLPDNERQERRDWLKRLNDPSTSYSTWMGKLRGGTARINEALRIHRLLQEEAKERGAS
ncbi:hypothetical protein ACFL2P_03505 [Candidatus Moduliflexota bacterium]